MRRFDGWGDWNCTLGQADVFSIEVEGEDDVRAAFAVPVDSILVDGRSVPMEVKGGSFVFGGDFHVHGSGATFTEDVFPFAVGNILEGLVIVAGPGGSEGEAIKFELLQDGAGAF